MSAKDYEVACPLPDCEAPLYVTWAHSYGLHPNDLVVDAGGVVPVPSDAHASTWQIECGDGHVVMLPGDTGCGCDDPQGEACPHGPGDDYDWSEDNRNLRPHDVARLRDLIVRLS